MGQFKDIPFPVFYGVRGEFYCIACAGGAMRGRWISCEIYQVGDRRRDLICWSCDQPVSFTVSLTVADAH